VITKNIGGGEEKEESPKGAQVNYKM